MTTKTIKVSDVVYREDLYPRIKPDPATIQRYAESLDILPPIEVNQHNELIDGYHRWTAHKLAEVADICADVTVTASDVELLALACERNAAHGLQLSEADKKTMAIRLYNGGVGLKQGEIARVLSVAPQTVSAYLSDAVRQVKERQKEKIFSMWLACHTQEEIAEACNVDQDTVSEKLKVLRNLNEHEKSVKLAANFDDDFQPPIYNVWTFAKKTNAVSHFGNTEERIVENLLWLYTEPLDIVVDPFGGGGGTINLCKKRLRRHWVSDRKPTPARNDIRLLDVAQELPSVRWSDVALTYLDPPYWRQAAGKYSTDAEDLANMPLDQFTKTLADVVKRIAAKQSKGVIALIIQPTQWNSDERRFSDHVVDLINAVGNKRLEVENRVSCPYSTEQCLPQMVDWAKANKKLLVLSRELIIWRVKP